MTIEKDAALRTLLRRVEEVRGLAERSDASTAVAPDDTATLVRVVSDLVEDHERLHRRLI